jgi:large subunit ribosomal protein L10
MKDIIVAKQKQVADLSILMKDCKSFVIFEYRGLTASTMTTLRKKNFDSGSKTIVLKNNILRRAAIDNKITEFEKISGPNAIAIGLKDELSVFKNIVDITKEFNFVKIKGGYFENKFISEQEVIALANIPSRDGLYSMLLSCLESPIKKFMYGLKAIADNKI